ncbi:MAG: MerR family transcriptional regulator [Bacteriovorax sp.]|nr:MerR family transcriptional regulator [Bacteriovorax sp.]
MLRSQVSTFLEIDIETIRYYESLNLITKPARLSNGYRTYNDKNLEEIKFIQHCRSLGIGLEEIKALKNLKPASDCTSANVIIEKNLKLIEQKILDLNLLQIQLENLSKSCSTKGTSENCGIVKSLVKESLSFKKTLLKNKAQDHGHKNESIQ